MKIKISWIIVVTLALFLTSCQNASLNENGNLIAAGGSSTTAVKSEPTPPNPPEVGKATVTGQVFSLKTNAPLANMVVRLAEVHRQGDEGAYLLDTAFSPGDITDEQGYFAFESIEPGEYVVVVGNVEVYNEYVIIPESSGKPLVYNFAADKVEDIGQLIVNLEPTS